LSFGQGTDEEVEQAENLSAKTKDCLFDKARYGTNMHHDPFMIVSSISLLGLAPYN